MHLSPDEFYSLTPLEFDYALKDYNERTKFNQQFNAELMRLQTAYLININLDQEHQITNTKKLMRFPWEEEEVKEIKEPDWERLEREIKGI